MLHPNGRLGTLRLCWHVLHAMRGDLVLALVLTLVCHLLIPPALEHKLSPKVLLPLLGISVSVFTAFRNTQAFQRWWDARTQWACMVSASREWRDGLVALQSQPGQHHLWELLNRRQVLISWHLNRDLRGWISASCAQATAQLEQELEIEPGRGRQELLRDQARGMAQLVKQGLIDAGPSRAMLLSIHSRILKAMGALEQIQQQPMPPSYSLFIRGIVWFFGLLLFLRMDEISHPHWSVVGFISLIGFVLAERLGALLEDPFTSATFGLPLDHICAEISADMLGQGHPSALPAQGPRAQVWT